MLVFTPGYYKTNYRALRLGEMIRWHGWQRGFATWLKTRFMRPSRTGVWMPGLWAENECQPEDLSPDFWQATAPHRRDFEQLGFVQCRLSKQTRVLDPLSRETAGIVYLDPTHRFLGQLLYCRSYRPALQAEVNEIFIMFKAAFDRGNLSCTNRRRSFDSPDAGRVIRLASYDVPLIHRRFLEALRRRSDSPRTFPDLESLRQWVDARQLRNFEDRVRRRLFVPMTEAEIAAARAALQPGSPVTPPPLPRGGFRLEFWPTVIVLLLLVSVLIARWRHQVPRDTIEYRGQQFRMRLPFASFEDYKDDPNNLDTNELARIEQTMETAKIPESFKNREAFFHFMVFDLEFPGYGLSGERARTDDDSTLDVESVEIPQADEDRVVVVRGSGGRLRRVDDFIYDTAGTNSIGLVRLEHRHLQYFDEAGHLVREKSL